MAGPWIRHNQSTGKCRHSAINQTRKYTGTRQFKVILRGGVVDPRAENAGQP
ncbi:unnamed protein product [Penicillium roqueforti FM164]|uniref:Genomic scaffold, ProqFM164S03 n=1 Tax=Penicillium roqueforti (strain FM164) TaxID=1365484 RepID=W6QWK9_PENRF|nr:unnamed protein product [Penicillium roqueforti FM164]